MEYLSAFYRQEGENASSLLLLQAYYKPKRMPVLLAAVCEKNAPGGQYPGENGVLLALKDWFYETGLYLCAEKGDGGWNRAVKELERKSFSYSTEYSAILCAGRHFLQFGQGEQRAYLLNTGINRRLCRKLVQGIRQEETGRKGIVQEETGWEGIMQEGIGILLVTSSFQRMTDEAYLAEVFDREALRTEQEMEARLKRVGAFQESRGGSDMGAVIFATR